MSAIQFISRHAASLICHLGGGVSHLATERGSQGIQITAVNSLAQMGSSSRDYWCVCEELVLISSTLWDCKTHNSSRRWLYSDLHFFGIFMHILRLNLDILPIWFSHKEGHQIMAMLVMCIWKTVHEGNFKGFSWIICIFSCFVWRVTCFKQSCWQLGQRSTSLWTLCCLAVWMFSSVVKVQVFFKWWWWFSNAFAVTCNKNVLLSY